MWSPSVDVRHRHAIGILASLLVWTAGCPYPEAAPTYAPPPSKFDRAWSAANGAASDLGVYVTSSDRSTGMIQGTKGDTNVNISVWTQADGSVRVEINVQSPKSGPDAGLAQSLSNAYERRMGR
jgi:hypothetical protein